MAALTYDDLAIRRDIPDFVAFMFATGLRIFEAAAGVWGDVDLKRRAVAVRGNVVRVKGIALLSRRTSRASSRFGRPSFSSDGTTQKPVRRRVPFSLHPRVGCVIPATRWQTFRRRSVTVAMRG